MGCAAANLCCFLGCLSHGPKPPCAGVTLFMFDPESDEQIKQVPGFLLDAVSAWLSAAMPAGACTFAGSSRPCYSNGIALLFMYSDSLAPARSSPTASPRSGSGTFTCERGNVPQMVAAGGRMPWDSMAAGGMLGLLLRRWLHLALKLSPGACPRLLQGARAVMQRGQPWEHVVSHGWAAVAKGAHLLLCLLRVCTLCVSCSDINLRLLVSCYVWVTGSVQCATAAGKCSKGAQRMFGLCSSGCFGML